MNFSDLIQKRRSVRQYANKPIAKEDILKCLEAARLAPSACNSQPWHFIVIDEPELKARVASRIFSGLYSMNKFAQDAPVLVAVVSEKMKILAAIGAQVRSTQYYLMDVGIACEHLILQAQELGIGSCWMGWFDEKALKEELRISKDKKIDIVIALGYSAEDKVAPRARKLLKEISSFNNYK
ncbi:MAG: nitroreductase family protein [Candidatus Omnitrophota bacterium]